MRCDAGHVDDAAGLLGDHDWRDMLHAEENAPHVDGHDRVESRHVDVSDIDDWQARAGVVDETVDAAEALQRLSDHGLNVVFLGDVGPDETDPEPLFERGAFQLAAGRGDDLRALLDEDFRDPFADPARRAGDDRDLSAQSAHPNSPDGLAIHSEASELIHDGVVGTPCKALSLAFAVHLDAGEELADGHQLEPVDVDVRRQSGHPQHGRRNVVGRHRVHAAVARPTPPSHGGKGKARPKQSTGRAENLEAGEGLADGISSSQLMLMCGGGSAARLAQGRRLAV